VIRASLENFKASFAEEILMDCELDLDSIRSLFEMAQKACAD
jgi:hypothetical protein